MEFGGFYSKMRLGKSLTIASHIVNIVIFIYFIITLLKIQMLDYTGLVISGFGMLISLIASTVDILDE